MYSLEFFSKGIPNQYTDMQCLMEHCEGNAACKTIFLPMKRLKKNERFIKELFRDVTMPVQGRFTIHG